MTFKIAQSNENPPNYKLVIWGLIAAAAFIVLFCLSGCNGINKATQRVLTNEAAFNKVGATWARLNPCVSDSSVVLLHDTTLRIDTSYQLLPGIHLTHNVHDTTLQIITKTIHIHDSVKVVAIDTREAGIWKDSAASYKLAYFQLQSAKQAEIDAWKNKARVRLWWLIGIAIAIAGYIGLRVWNPFAKLGVIAGK